MNDEEGVAIIDTGSAITLLSHKMIKKFEWIMEERKRKPALIGVTGMNLHIIGMLKVKVTVGKSDFYKYLPVVPTNYLQGDVLLGADILGTGSLLWWGVKGLVEFNGVRMPCKPSYTTSQHAWCRGVRIRSGEKREDRFAAFASRNVYLEPNTTRVVRVKVNRPRGTVLIVHPRLTELPFPTCVKVDDKGCIPCTIENKSKYPREVKKGLVIARFGLPVNVVSNNESSTPEIVNDLIPPSMATQTSATRSDTLSNVMSAMDWSHLTVEQEKELKELVMSFEGLFIVEKGELGLITGPDAHIQVANPVPAKGRSFRYPERAKKIIAEMLKDMHEKDIIEPSTSAWLSPIVLVSKPDGSKRMCLDYRLVNTHLAEDIHPLPRLEELVEVAAGNKFYATLDMREAYFQIKLGEDSRDLTTFSDGASLYRFKRLPFGLQCSPAIFSRKMEEIIAPLMKEGWVRNYLDDIILWASSFDELLLRLKCVMQALKDKGVKLNLKKCDLGKEEVKFLGYIVSEQGARPDPMNVEAVLRKKPPTTVKGIRSF
ncbi:MAG: reverse transcriptase family protein, partial [Cyanobacteria bacterium J06553_1]